MESILCNFSSAVGKTNETGDRFPFNKHEQSKGGSFKTFHAVVRSLSKTCNYCDKCVNSILRDRVVLGIRDLETQPALLKEHCLTLNSCINIC